MKKKSSHFIHIVVAAAAAVNLAAVVLFGYGLSPKTPAVQAAERASSARAAADLAGGESSSDSIAPSDSAAGSENAAKDSESNVEDPGKMSESDTGEESTAAEVSSPDAAASGDNTYTGPSITLSDEIPTLRVSELSECVTVFRDLGLISATDGYGNDVSSLITAEYKAVDDSLSSFILTFSIVNRNGDTAHTSCEVGILEVDLPYLELSDERVVLHTGDDFQYMKYVTIAKDTNGGRLFDNIELKGDLRTDTAGTYEMTYTITSRVTGDRVSRTLTVVVEG